jgi:small membrane protein
MTVFQILGLLLVAVMLVTSVRNLMQVRARPLASALWLLLWAAAGAAISAPDATTRVAKLLGINRGADLLVYCTALASFVGFFLVYVKIRQLTRDITVLTRELAFLRATPPARAIDTVSQADTHALAD